MALGPYVLFLLFLAIGTGVLALLMRKRAIARIVVGQMALVTSQGMPLATGLMLAGRSEPGKAGLILRRIANLLAKGLPLDEALSLAYRSCPGLVRSAMRAGERAGRLGPTLRLLEDDLVDRAERRTGVISFGIPYAMVLLVFQALIWSAILIAIVPKFKEIFKDFGCQLPALTTALIGASDFFVRSGLAALMVVFLMLGVPLGLYWLFRPRRPDRPRLASRVADYLRWVTPGLRRMELAGGLGTVTSLMRLFVGAGMSLEQAASLAAETDVNIVLRRRVRRFAMLLSQGTPPPTAAVEAGLGDVMATALRLGQHGEQLDPALRFVADYCHGTVSRLWIVIRSVAWPLMTCTMAILIGTMVVALFLPLAALINSVMGGI